MVQGARHAPHASTAALYADQRAFSRAPIERLERITLATDRVHDLRPLERAPRLRHVVLDGTRVDDLAPLAALPQLEELSLYDNPGVGDHAPLGALGALVRLTVGVTSSGGWLIGAKTLGALEGLRALRHVSLYGRTSPSGLAWLADTRRLRSLSVYAGSVDPSWLRGLTSLRSLRLTRFAFEDISALADLTKLEDLWLTEGRLRAVGPLSSLRRLGRLLLGHNRIEDITALSRLSRLERLDLPRNRVTALPDLSALRRLETLDIGHNRVASLRGLERVRSLRWLFAQHNPLLDVGAIAHHPRVTVALLGRATAHKRAVLATLPALVRSA